MHGLQHSLSADYPFTCFTAIFFILIHLFLVNPRSARIKGNVWKIASAPKAVPSRLVRNSFLEGFSALTAGRREQEVVLNDL